MTYPVLEHFRRQGDGSYRLLLQDVPAEDIRIEAVNREGMVLYAVIDIEEPQLLQALGLEGKKGLVLPELQSLLRLVLNVFWDDASREKGLCFPLKKNGIPSLRVKVKETENSKVSFSPNRFC